MILQDAVSRNFKHRIPHELQAPKMADVWPIEHVRSLLKVDVKAKDPQNSKDLRKYINQS